MNTEFLLNKGHPYFFPFSISEFKVDIFSYLFDKDKSQQPLLLITSFFYEGIS